MAGAFDYTPAPKARRLAIFAVIGVALMCIFALMAINTAAFTLSFLMVPTLAIFLWPQGANPVLSLIGIAAAGFFLDYLSYGPFGLWPLTWLMIFLIYRPDARAKPTSFLGNWTGALIVIVGVVVLQILLAGFFLAMPIDWSSMILSAMTAFFVFPIIYTVREYCARAFGNREDFFYERRKP